MDRNPGTPERRDAFAVRDLDQKQMATISADPNLTVEGKRAAMAGPHLTAKAKVAALGQAEQDRLATDTVKAENLLFDRSPSMAGSDAISARDAADRAEQLRTPADAAKLLGRAHATGDTALAGAVAAHAHGQGWGQVVATHAATSRARQAAYDGLMASGAPGGRSDQMTRRMVFSVPPPTELAGLRDAQLRTLAGQDAPPRPTTTCGARGPPRSVLASPD